MTGIGKCPRPILQERFEKAIDFRGEDECWEWKAFRDRVGGIMEWAKEREAWIMEKYNWILDSDFDWCLQFVLGAVIALITIGILLLFSLPIWIWLVMT